MNKHATQTRLPNESPFPTRHTAARALTKRRARIRALARLYVLLPPLFLLVLWHHGVAARPAGTLGLRLRTLLRARRAAGVLGPWWVPAHQELHALCIAAGCRFGEPLPRGNPFPKGKARQGRAQPDWNGPPNVPGTPPRRPWSTLAPGDMARIRGHRLGGGCP